MSEQQYIILKNGRKRKATMVTCLYCGKEFLKANNQIKLKQNHYCGNKCLLNAIQKKRKENVKTQPDVFCAYCGKKIERKHFSKTKSGLHFCNRICKGKACKIDGNCPEIRPAHYGNSETMYRDKMQTELTVGCIDCGEKRNYMLHVHHIDGDRSNNDKSNLEVVCGNCHIKRHMVFTNNEWHYCARYLTSRKMLKNL